MEKALEVVSDKVPLAPEVLAVARVVPDLSRVEEARVRAEVVEGRSREPHTGIEGEPLVYPVRGEEGRAAVSLHGMDFSPPFCFTDSADQVIALVRQKVENGLLPGEAAGEASACFEAERERIYSSLADAEKRYEEVRLISQKDLEVPRGWGVIFHSEWEGLVCDDGLIVYDDGTTLKYRHYHRQPGSREKVNLEINLEVAKGGTERLEAMLATSLGEAGQRVYKEYHQKKAQGEVVEAERQAGALAKATESANVAVLAVHSEVLGLLPVEEARRMAADLVATRRAYQGAVGRTDTGEVWHRDLEEVDGGVRAFLRDPIRSACAHSTSQELGYIAGERPKREKEGGLRIETTFAITPTEETHRLVEEEVGYSLTGGVETSLPLMRFRYGGQSLVDAGSVTGAFQATRDRQYPTPSRLAPVLSPETEARVRPNLDALPPDLAAGFEADLARIPQGARGEMEAAVQLIKKAAERQRFHDRNSEVARSLGAVDPYWVTFAGKEVEIPGRYQDLVDQGWLRYMVTEGFGNTFLPRRLIYMESRSVVLDLEAKAPGLEGMSEEMARAQAVVIPFWELFRAHNNQVSLNGRLISGYKEKLHQLLRHEVPEEGIVVARVGMSKDEVLCEHLLEQSYVLSQTGIPVVPGLKPEKIETREEGGHRVTEVTFWGDSLPEVRGPGRYWLKLTSVVDREDGTFIIEEKVGVDRTIEE